LFSASNHPIEEDSEQKEDEKQAPEDDESSYKEEMNKTMRL